jgi:hypothetical protein
MKLNQMIYKNTIKDEKDLRLIIIS